jgi:hypothetical protein
MRGAIPLVCVSVTLALATACTLNPQPLPPDQPPDQAGAGGSAGSTGSTGTEPADAATNRAQDASLRDAGHILPPVVEAGADSREDGPAEAAVDGSGDAVSECGDASSEGGDAWDAWSPRD